MAKMSLEDDASKYVGGKEKQELSVLERHYPRRDLVLVPLPFWKGSFQMHVPSGPITAADYAVISEACGRVCANLKERIVDIEDRSDER